MPPAVLEAPAAAANADLHRRLREALAGILEGDQRLASLEPAGLLERARFVRAGLLLDVAGACGVPAGRSFGPALAVELLHLATLVHDDVIDGTGLRRGRAATRRLRGHKVAVPFGDYLFALAVEGMLKTGSGLELPGLFLARVRETCHGEVAQSLLSAGRGPAGLEEVMEVAAGRTGSLFAFCAEAPFWMAGSPQEVRLSAGLAGKGAGLAFQVADDALDLAGRPGDAGRPPGRDLLEACPTLPLRLLSEELGLSWPAFRDRFGRRPEELRDLFLASTSGPRLAGILGRLRLETMDAARRAGGADLEGIIGRFWEEHVSASLPWPEEPDRA